ncbi:MAG: chemotaxis protein CheA [Gemmatimonadaceae bacterium]
MSSLDMDRLREVFQQEAEETLAAMEEALLRLEEHPDQPGPLNDVFRHAHTIKGSAAMVGSGELAAYAHRVEDALDLMRQGALEVTPERITLLLQIVDAIRSMLAAESRGGVTHVRAMDSALVDRLAGGAVAAPGTRDDLETGAMDGAASAEQRSSRMRSLRVEMRKLDALLSLSGEIAVARGRLMRADDGHHDTQGTAAEEMERLLAELHEQVTDMRLVPLGPAFRQHSRTVRDIASVQGKLVRLVIEGEDVEVDASIVEQLRDPLTHLVRNAVDHGVELASARRDAGKDPCATVVLHARHERGLVIVEVRDDGQGLRRERILAKATERGLLRTGDGEHLADSQVFALAMLPGFSTAERITEVSGRGVGMDIVKRNVEAIRGTVEIESTPGEGTTMRLRLPLTVAIIDGFVVGVGHERYVLPLDAVTECLTLPAADAGAPAGVLSLRGDALPYVRLRHLLGLRDATAPSRESVVVVQVGGRRAGLVVDQLHGETQAVLKPLAAMFAGAPGISGTTIMGDGRVSLILDVGELVDQARHNAAA